MARILEGVSNVSLRRFLGLFWLIYHLFYEGHIRSRYDPHKTNDKLAQKNPKIEKSLQC